MHATDCACRHNVVHRALSPRHTVQELERTNIVDSITRSASWPSCGGIPPHPSLDQQAGKLGVLLLLHTDVSYLDRVVPFEEGGGKRLTSPAI